MCSPIAFRGLPATIAALILLAAPAAAQEHDAQLWTTTSAAIDLGPDVELALEWIARFGDDAGGLYEMELGGMLAFEVAEGVELAAGYVRVPSYGRGAPHRIEDRPRQQIAFTSGQLSGRVRFEQRFRSDGEDVGLRLRPQIGWSMPLGGKTSLRLSHESFFALNSTDWGQASGYERMRNSAGVRTPITARITAEAGYLNQYSLRRGAADQMAHVLSVALGFRF